MKRYLMLLAVILMLCQIISPGLADTWTGQVVAADLTEITAGADGQLREWSLRQGQTVTAGDHLGSTEAESYYAPADGTVAALHAEAGDTVSGTVLEIDPVSRYRVVCTVSGAKQTVENTLIHIGETLYIKCTADGTHRAVGRVISLDGSEYEMETLGGELYVGETVYIYRDLEFSSDARVGTGTVVASDTIACEGSGKLLTLQVEEGDTVERGQLLYTTASDAETEVRAPVDGVVTEVLAEKGSVVSKDQILAWVAGGAVLQITAPEEETADFSVGQRLNFTRGDDPHDTLYGATVSRILHHVSDASVTVELKPDEAGLPIGLSIEVTNDTE